MAPQAVDHPYLVVYSRTSNLMTENMVDTENGEQVCGICNDPLEDPVVSYLLFGCAILLCSAFVCFVRFFLGFWVF